ncbi:alpha/beta fold hydrolase [Capilliphycus salinus ALCB114379]|uniref:alpha/beta fold hydrolase n=1 Tax=Capilliphycus salinus TaxID=2768948 RepID=UPI0039A603E4
MIPSEFVQQNPNLKTLCFLQPAPPQPNLPLFVFLPGMDGTGQLLHTQIPGLANVFDIRCLSIPLEDRSNWYTLTTRTIALIQSELARNHSRPVYVCGESFGGCLALNLALKAPQLVDRLILINPASSFKQQPWLQWGSFLTQSMPGWFYPSSVLTILPFLASLGRISPDDRQALIKTMKSVPQQTSAWRLELLQSFHFDTHRLCQVKKPVLVIAGAADLLLPSVREAEFLVKHLPNSRFVVLPRSGHACLLETDIDLLEILQQQHFLGKLVSQSSMSAIAS